MKPEGGSAKTVGVFEAKTRFSALIADATDGKTTVVTKNGRPVAEVGPMKHSGPSRSRIAAQRLRALRARLAAEGKLKGIDIRELMYEGRR